MNISRSIDVPNNYCSHRCHIFAQVLREWGTVRRAGVKEGTWHPNAAKATTEG